MITTKSTLAFVVAAGGAMAVIGSGWDWIHQGFQTKDAAVIQSITSQVNYHEIRLEEYQAVSEDKRDNTWNMRVGAHKERLKMNCDELIKKDVRNRVCDNL